MIALYTGMRIGEVLALTIEDFNLMKIMEQLVLIKQLLKIKVEKELLEMLLKRKTEKEICI